MAINWNPTGRFSFGNLSGAQQTMYEDNPALAWQQLMNYYGQGNPNFATTTLGRYIQSRMGSFNNEYMTAAGQQQADWANQKSAWDANVGTRREAAAKALSDYAATQPSRYGPLVDYAGRPIAGSGPGGSYDPNDSLRWTQPGVRDLSTDPQYQQLLNNYNHVGDAWQAPGPQLTLTRYMEQNPGAAGDFARQFNMLGPSERGANPGAFQVRRNLW